MPDQERHPPLPTPPVASRPPFLRSRASRRSQILSSAVQLFRAHGFHGVGVDEIGSGAGVTGPAVYRHFKSKHSVLLTVFEEVIDHLLEAAQEIENGTAREEILEKIVAFHLDLALDNGELIAVYEQEERNLPAADRRRIRERQRLYLEHWFRALSAERPELSFEQLRSRTHATIGLLNSVAHYRVGLSRGEARRVLLSMAVAAMRAP